MSPILLLRCQLPVLGLWLPALTYFPTHRQRRVTCQIPTRASIDRLLHPPILLPRPTILLLTRCNLIPQLLPLTLYHPILLRHAQHVLLVRCLAISPTMIHPPRNSMRERLSTSPCWHNFMTGICALGLWRRGFGS